MDRTNSMGLWRYAKEFSDAGSVIIEKHIGATPPRPAYYLYCHAIELALKAFLRGSGMTLVDLKKLGHDINQILTKALGLRLGKHCALNPDMVSAIELVSQTYRDKGFEYIKTGAKTVPRIEILRSSAELLVSSLERFCYDHRSVHDSSGGQ